MNPTREEATVLEQRKQREYESFFENDVLVEEVCHVTIAYDIDLCPNPEEGGFCNHRLILSLRGQGQKVIRAPNAETLGNIVETTLAVIRMFQGKLNPGDQMELPSTIEKTNSRSTSEDDIPEDDIPF